MPNGHQTIVPHTWSTLERLPWPESSPFKAAKIEIQIRAKEISKLRHQDIKSQKDRYAAEFVSKNTDWIPQNHQAWARRCISRMMFDTIRNKNRGSRNKASVIQEVEDDSTAD